MLNTENGSLTAGIILRDIQELMKLYEELSDLQQPCHSACEITDAQRKDEWDDYNFRAYTFIRGLGERLLGKRVILHEDDRF